MMPNMPETPETPSESVDTPSQELSRETIPDFAQGYAITICVYPDGFEVEGPKPLPQGEESDEPSAEHDEKLPDLTTALKHVIAIHKEHPVDSDLEGHFQAGLGEEA